jgi:hypothetical protein
VISTLTTWVIRNNLAIITVAKNAKITMVKNIWHKTTGKIKEFRITENNGSQK